mmetsp:Transcript_943/g.1726  ORF Transcript_943/g.1726 Transcript_943/m.1726 type:complete len:93 (+) Transcript_943:1172-1450(+)
MMQFEGTVGGVTEAPKEWEKLSFHDFWRDYASSSSSSLPPMTHTEVPYQPPSFVTGLSPSHPFDTGKAPNSPPGRQNYFRAKTAQNPITSTS